LLPDLHRARHDLACIDVPTMRGLEIGPLAAPRVRKCDGDVMYVDHLDAEGLRVKYAADPVLRDRLDQIVDVDRVMGDGEGMYEALADHAPFDYVIASHLIEHIPDPVAWLSDLAAVLCPGGILSLIIPDKRFTFDVNRRTTEIGDLVDGHLRRLTRPSFKHAYDFISKEITESVDPAAIWAGVKDYAGVVRSDVPDPDVAALQLCRTLESSSQYVDVHCSVFTPESFLCLLEKLVRLGLIEFEVAHFVPTELNQLDFHVSLRRTDSTVDRVLTMERQLASVRRAYRATAHVPAGLHSSVTAPTMMAVSPRERTMIAEKRRIIATLRRGSAVLRHWAHSRMPIR
jgi:SAM-dependent methyltransferase